MGVHSQRAHVSSINVAVSISLNQCLDLRLSFKFIILFHTRLMFYAAAVVYSVFRMTGGKVALSIKKWEQHIQMPGKGL